MLQDLKMKIKLVGVDKVAAIWLNLNDIEQSLLLLITPF